MFDLGNKKLWQKKNFLVHNSIFDLEKKILLVKPPKLPKIIGVFKVKFSSKIDI